MEAISIRFVEVTGVVRVSMAIRVNILRVNRPIVIRVIHGNRRGTKRVEGMQLAAQALKAVECTCLHNYYYHVMCI